MSNKTAQSIAALLVIALTAPIGLPMALATHNGNGDPEDHSTNYWSHGPICIDNNILAEWCDSNGDGILEGPYDMTTSKGNASITITPGGVAITYWVFNMSKVAVTPYVQDPVTGVRSFDPVRWAAWNVTPHAAIFVKDSQNVRVDGVEVFAYFDDVLVNGLPSGPVYDCIAGMPETEALDYGVLVVDSIGVRVMNSIIVNTLLDGVWYKNSTGNYSYSDTLFNFRNGLRVTGSTSNVQTYANYYGANGYSYVTPDLVAGGGTLANYWNPVMERDQSGFRPASVYVDRGGMVKVKNSTHTTAAYQNIVEATWPDFRGASAQATASSFTVPRWYAVTVQNTASGAYGTGPNCSVYPWGVHPDAANYSGNGFRDTPSFASLGGGDPKMQCDGPLQPPCPTSEVSVSACTGQCTTSSSAPALAAPTTKPVTTDNEALPDPFAVTPGWLDYQLNWWGSPKGPNAESVGAFVSAPVGSLVEFKNWLPAPPPVTLTDQALRAAQVQHIVYGPLPEA